MRKAERMHERNSLAVSPSLLLSLAEHKTQAGRQTALKDTDSTNGHILLPSLAGPLVTIYISIMWIAPVAGLRHSAQWLAPGSQSPSLLAHGYANSEATELLQLLV